MKYICKKCGFLNENLAPGRKRSGQIATQKRFAGMNEEEIKEYMRNVRAGKKVKKKME